jgi:hypothetical protein
MINHLTVNDFIRIGLICFEAVLNGTYDVSLIVTSAKYNGPECIRPVSEDELPRGQLSLL